MRLLLLLTILAPYMILAQSSMLCQGAYFTEPQAHELHAEWLSNYKTLPDWKKKAKVIRKGIYKGAELPRRLPETPLNPIIRDKKVMAGYTVENVAFESLPGLFVTGNLYRPLKLNPSISMPGIASPHGHWSEPNDYGRFRVDMQQRCANLARMGAVVFAYDMLGYGESDQCAHRHPLSLKAQLINGIRVLDFLESLEGVDPTRLAVTGASGGGTQSFLLAAIDKRVAVSVPVVMVSAHFFGGCVCESGMPIHKSINHQTSNVEIAALAAPRPMLIVSDGEDWTKNVPEVEFPFIQKIYSLYGKSERVENAHIPNEGHDYGFSKREPMYSFMAKHLGLNLNAIMDTAGKIDESPVRMLSREALSVFGASFTLPAHALQGDEAISALLHALR